MELTLTNDEIKSKTKLKGKIKESLRNIQNIYDEDELFGLVLSAIRTNDFNMIKREKRGRRIIHKLDIQKVEKWVKEKVIPNTVRIDIEDKEFLKFLTFCLAMPYKMFAGETRATLTEVVQRTKKRDYLQIFSDHFIGKIGEVAFKQYAKENFNKEVKLDWKIGEQREKFKSDIVNSKRIISIKATDTLDSIWAKTGIGENPDYGIFVKVTLPKDFFIKILSNISSFKKLINYIADKIKENGNDVMELLKYVEETAYKEKLIIKAFICGYFKPNKSTLRKKGEKLAFIGEVHNDAHMIECNKLRYTKEDWINFFEDIF